MGVSSVCVVSIFFRGFVRSSFWWTLIDFVSVAVGFSRCIRCYLWGYVYVSWVLFDHCACGSMGLSRLFYRYFVFFYDRSWVFRVLFTP